MEFNNCAAWAKGWYKQRKNVSAWWMDLAHCINNDRWTVHSKGDVVAWCLARFDDDNEFFKKANPRFGFSDMSYHFERYDRLYDDVSLDFGDKVVLYFKDCLSTASKFHFKEGGYKPANWVLPFRLEEPWYEDGTYTSDHKPVFHFGEMMCDAEKRVNEMFSDLSDQKPYYSFTDWDAEHNFDHIESALERKNWKDVVVDLGVEVGCELYSIPGTTLVSQGRTSCIYFDTWYASLGRYAHSIGYDANKTYTLYIKHIVRNVDYGDGVIERQEDHKIMKIEEK